MHLELTQILVCPYCGPPNGLIVFVDEMQERRIVSGRLDCPVCERRHAVRDGIVRLGDAADAGGAVGAGGETPDDDAAPTTAALLGFPEGPEILLVAGGAEAIAPALAGLRPEAAVVTFGSASIERHARVYPVVPSGDHPHLPFRPGSLDGAVLTGDRADLVTEIAPALAAGARLVVLAPRGARPGRDAPSLRELAADARAWVGVRA